MTSLSSELEHTVEIHVPFHDVDGMHVVWHGHYAKYLEIARCRLLAKLDLDFEVMQARAYSWPVVKMQQKFIKPARYNDILLVTAKAVAWDSLFVMDYVVVESRSGDLLMKAQTSQAAIDMKSGETCFRLPEFFRTRLQEHNI